jgi:CelD/BcsL family acetyltransferase involved in cellulose biosynthesis
VTPWRFEWRRTWDAVWAPEFVTEWERLLESSPHANVYHVPALVRAWAETHGKALDAEPLFGLATGPHGARVLLTFVVSTQRGRHARRRSLSAAGEGFFGYHDPLVSAPNVADIDWSEFWDLVRRETAGECDQALLRFVHADYASGPLTAPGSDASPLLDVSSCRSLDDAFVRCSKDHRHETRRLLRRLGDRGTIVLYVADPGDAAVALEDLANGFLPVYHAYWRARPAGSMFDRAGVLEFARRVIDEGTRDRWAEYGRMTVGGRPIAWYVGLVHRESFYLWITTYDVAYQEFSPGRLLLALIIQRSIERGMQFVHLLTGDQHYKREWRPTQQSMRTVRWYAPTVKGRLLGWYDYRHRASTLEAE